MSDPRTDLTRVLGSNTSSAATADLAGLAPDRWREMLGSAADHRVHPFLTYGRPADHVPADVVSAVRGERRRILAQHMQACAALAWIARVLEAADVRWLVFKGPVLAEVVYPAPDLRPYGDLDILVHPMDLAVGLAALEEAGAALIDVNWPLIVEHHRGELSLRLPFGPPLDVHWHVVNEPSQRQVFPIDPADMLRRRRSVKIGGTPVPTLDNLDTLLHLGLHAVRSGGHRLQWLVDIDLAVRTFAPDPPSLRRRADESSTHLPLATMLGRSWRMWRSPWPPQAIDEFADGKLWRALTAGLDKVKPPGGAEARGWTWQTALRSTRRGSRESLAALMAASRTGFRHHAHALGALAARSSGQDEIGNPLHIAHGDSRDRETYLDNVRREWETESRRRGV